MSEPPADLNAEPPQGEEAPVAPTIEKIKRRHRRIEESEEDFTAADEVALLSAALESARRRRQSSEQASPTRTKINRFLTRGEPAAAADPAKAPPPPALASPSAGAATPAFKPLVPREPRPWRPGRWLRRLGLAAAAAVLVYGGYLAGRRDAVPPEAAPVIKPPENATIPAPLLAVPDEWLKALDADRSGDLTTALRLMNGLASRMELRPSLQAYRATLDTRQNYFNDAEADLARTLNADASAENLATINTARAFNFVRDRQFNRAIECFAAVARANPLDAANYEHWGETLRRTGNLAEAADKFRLALARIPASALPDAGAQREYYAYVLRLSLAEAGREGDLQPELSRRLAEPAPGGYWLLTAAAVALQKGELAAAAQTLERVKGDFSRGEFAALLGDYYYRAFIIHPEIKPFLADLTDAQWQARRQSMEYFIDP